MKKDNHFKEVNMVCAIGKLLCNNEKEKNVWDKRMLSTIRGLSFPEDFDTLSEKEKRKRLDKVLEVIK